MLLELEYAVFPTGDMLVVTTRVSGYYVCDHCKQRSHGYVSDVLSTHEENAVIASYWERLLVAGWRRYSTECGDQYTACPSCKRFT